MRILWISDSPDTPSGFGNVTRFVCEGLAKRGHTVNILGWQTRAAHSWQGCNVFPTTAGSLGCDALFPLLVRQRPEIVIALGDVWWLPYFSAPHLRRQMELTDTPWMLYFPIDGDMTGERLPQSWLDLLREVDYPVAMSQYGKRVVEKNGIPCTYIPHGVDLNVFCPPADRAAAKASLGAAGKFFILSDSRNQPRKMLPRLLDVFSRFSAQCPEAYLHLHTDPDDEFTRSGVYSYNVREDLRHLGIQSKVSFTPGLAMKYRGGVPLGELARYYQAADVHLLASSGEGFGLPTLQAAAAGAVPVACAYSASKELVENHGESIAILEWYENEFGIRRGMIDVDDAVHKLTGLYQNPARLAECSRRSRQFAMPYDWENVINQWDGLLRTIGRRRHRVVATSRTTAVPLETISPALVPKIDGVNIKVNVVQRQYGRLEANMLSEVRGHLPDGQVPAIQQPCQVGKLRVLRNPGHVGVALGDENIFSSLKRIFPMMDGWMPVWNPSNAPSLTGLAIVGQDNWAAARYKMAQSILLLNSSGELSDEFLMDAGLFGVACIGSGTSEVQQKLWPELVAQDERQAAALARELLTNPARLRGLTEQAVAECRRLYSRDEEEIADCLRRLHQEQRSAPMTSTA